MEKKGKVVMFFVDHLSGEDMGYMIEKLYEWNAKNVHAVQTITKKNRPGSIVFVDLGSSDECIFVKKIANEFGIYGCQFIETTHKYQPVICSQKKFTIRHESDVIDFIIRFKQLESDTDMGFIRIEHDDLKELKKVLEDEYGLNFSIKHLRHSIEEHLLTKDSSQELRI